MPKCLNVQKVKMPTKLITKFESYEKTVAAPVWVICDFEKLQSPSVQYRKYFKRTKDSAYRKPHTIPYCPQMKELR